MAKAAQKKPPEDVVEFFYDVDQRSDEWFALRRGIVTTSKLSAVMASGKEGGDSVGRDKYMDLLAGEIISGQVAESFRSEAMERGTRMEPEAREWYSRTRFVDLTPIGFVKRTFRSPLGSDFALGCSPDSQVGDQRKGIEIKSMAPHLLVHVSRQGAAGFPSSHRAQIQGTMLACGWEEMELILFYTGWPNPPTFLLRRDENYIRRIKDEVERFTYELKMLVKEVRKKHDDGER